MTTGLLTSVLAETDEIKTLTADGDVAASSDIVMVQRLNSDTSLGLRLLLMPQIQLRRNRLL